MNLNQEENKFSFPVKQNRIRKLKDFKKILEFGNFFYLSFGTTRMLRNDKNILRVVISVSKKFSKKSSKRNRIKRKLIELFRLRQHKLKGFDIWIYIRIYKNEEEILKETEEFLNTLIQNPLKETF